MAQMPSIDFEEICNQLIHKSNETRAESNREDEQEIENDSTSELIIIDKGFCEVYLESISDTAVKDINESINNLTLDLKPFYSCNNNLNDKISIIESKKDKWKIRFYASHSFTTYFATDIKFRSTRYNVDIKDYEWAERGSREFFKSSTWKEEGNNPSQMLDEPSNTFTVSIEKNNNEFFLTAFHPKFLQKTDQIKYMKGTIDGVEVDGNYDINKPFDGYNQEPGEMELVRNQNTHLEMMFELGYGRRIPIVKGRFGSIVYTPSIAAGITGGKNLTVVVKEGQWWDFDDYEPEAYWTIQGFGGSILNRLEFNSKNERVGVFYENRFSYYKQNHEFMDGNQEYDLKLMGHNVGVKFMLYNPARKRNKREKKH